MMKLSDFDQAPTLYKLGINYHAYGDIKDGRNIVARWFKADKVTQEQKEALQACLNRDIKYRGKRNKRDKKEDPDCEVYLHIVFDIQYEKGDEE